MKKTVWTFGLIAGAILSAMMLLALPFQDAIGFDRAAVVGYTTMVLAFLLVYFGVRSYRDTVAGGSVGFGRAFAVGALIVAVASACYTATWEVIYIGMDSDFTERYQAHVVEKAREDGETQAEIDARVAEMERFAALYRNPAFNAAITFLEPLPVGLLIALVSAGVLGKRRRLARQSSGSMF
jgi:hypothetical protein